MMSNAVAVNSPWLKPSSGCEDHGFTLVNGLCRPSERIDFYLITDQSRASDSDRRKSYDDIANTFSEYFQEGRDRISCLAFAKDLYPLTAVPDQSWKDGCAARRILIEGHIKDDKDFDQKTDFRTLFSKISEILKKERDGDSSREGSRLGAERHRDLILIISDGVDDPDNANPNCNSPTSLKISPGLQTELVELEKKLSRYPDEAWIFLVIAGAQPGCGSNIEAMWKNIKIGDGPGMIDWINVIRLTQDGTVEPVIREVFDAIVSSAFQLKPEHASLSQEDRAGFDANGWFKVRYHIQQTQPADSRVAGRGRAIRSPLIPVQAAYLVGPGEDDKELIFSCNDISSRLSGRSVTLIDTSNESVDLVFNLERSGTNFQSTKNYQLQLRLGDISSARAVEIPATRRSFSVLYLKMALSLMPWIFLLSMFAFMSIDVYYFFKITGLKKRQRGDPRVKIKFNTSYYGCLLLSVTLLSSSAYMGYLAQSTDAAGAHSATQVIALLFVVLFTSNRDIFTAMLAFCVNFMPHSNG